MPWPIIFRKPFLMKSPMKQVVNHEPRSSWNQVTNQPPDGNTKNKAGSYGAVASTMGWKGGLVFSNANTTSTGLWNEGMMASNAGSDGVLLPLI